MHIGGAKNSALKLMAATLLAPGASVLHNVPDILDVAVMSQLLEQLGCTVKVEHPAISVTDEEVEETVKGLREQRATYDPIEDRAAADGDFVQISFEGRDKADAEAKPKNFRIPLDLKECGGCHNAEYACICDE